MTKVNVVSARFGGRDMQFGIARSDLEAFEHYTGYRSFALLTDLLGKGWGATDVARVLRFASADGPARRWLHRISTTGSTLVSSPHVDATLSVRPVGDYAPLAAAIITAMLFGLDEADATFSDETADGQ